MRLLNWNCTMFCTHIIFKCVEELSRYGGMYPYIAVLIAMYRT